MVKLNLTRCRRRMTALKRKWLNTGLVAILLVIGRVSFGGESLRKAGDVLQFASPIAAYVMTSYNNKSIHFLIHYLQTMGVTGLGKWSGKRLKYGLALRPDRSAYTGMPSGHTASCWLPASYMRNYDGWSAVTFGLYGAAILTAFSRIKSKRHTPIQVLASIVLCESVATLNKKYLQHLYINDSEIGIRVRL